MKRLLACIFCLAVLAAQSPLVGLSPTPSQNNSQETLMLFARQADDPVHIVQASFGADNTLLDAHLQNKSHQKIQSYRLGWAAIKKDDVRMTKGDAVAVPESVDSGSEFDITGQGASVKADLAKHPTGIMFYIAELQFKDGTQWQADPKKVRKEATDMVR
ncbi:MAG TPA: hypothetical protein VH724_02710 [Candidatus Angelobacter sp.]|nr:hypothetical protein [Candidatus Angelobacter sp.]